MRKRGSRAHARARTRMFERRVSGGRALEQAFKQRVIRGERESVCVRAGQTQATEQRMHA